MKLKVPLALAILVAMMLGLAASAAGTATTAPAVKVTLSEWKLRTLPANSSAGKVTFLVTNTGKLQHEFVIVKTNLTPAKLPVKGAKASETGRRGAIQKIAPGKTKKLTVNLASGKYVLLCNLPGHYKLGQRAGFVAKSTESSPKDTSVAVSAFEMGFKLSQTTVPVGKVTFTVTNDGKLPHDFSFGSKGGGTKLLAPGEAGTLTVTFAKPGKYTFICTVEGHQEAGMIGVLTVK